MASSVGDDETLRSEGLSSSPPVADTPDTDMEARELKADGDKDKTNGTLAGTKTDSNGAAPNGAAANSEAANGTTEEEKAGDNNEKKDDESKDGEKKADEENENENKDEDKKDENSRPPSRRSRTASSVSSSDDDSDNESPWITNLKSSSGLAKGMAKGIISYTKDLENRIRYLENAERERIAREEEAAREKENGEGEDDAAKEGGEEEAVVSEETTKPEKAGTGLLMETKFFNAQVEFSSDGTWKHNNIDVPGTFQCRGDPNRFLRVLYNWRDDVKPRILDEGEHPKREEIEILFISIQSEAIADFFTKRLNLKADKSGAVRMGKPFRPLLRNWDSIVDQMNELAKMYPDKPADAEGDGDEKKEPAENPAPNENEANNSNASETGDPLPFAGPKEEEKESFDKETALPHFRFLHGFVLEYLDEQVQRMRALRLGQRQKIAFEDLWMIFDAGDTIYCPRHEGGVAVGEDHTTKPRYVPQLFRVLGSVGGLQLRKTLAPRGNNPLDQYDEFFGDQMFSGPFIRGTWSKLQGNSSNAASSRRARDQLTSMYVMCFHVDFDGTKYGTVKEIFTFKPYDGLVDIRSLEAYPTQYLSFDQPQPDSSTGDKYLERGRKFVDVMAFLHMLYGGFTVGKSQEEINSAVIVDFKLAFQEYGHAFADGSNVVPKMSSSLTDSWPSPQGTEIHQFYSNTCSLAWCHQTSCLLDVYADWYQVQAQKVAPKIKALLEEYESSKFQTVESLEELKKYMEEKDLIRLLPGTVPGFALRNRKWVQLDLELLEKLEQGDDWHKLVLPPGHRKMVQAMVETHTRGSQQPMWAGSSHQGKVAMDLVQGKGRGCIILLHGVPGVGKTSTAETVASYTQRPLYPITCGDIGYVPEDVEKNMEEHFKLAHKWGCVLLLDEADVFLAKRTKGDVKRNGLVSVFLRILEYYSGILFLTTNRVGAIDDAFRSRLHLTLYYPKLSKTQTIKIWENNLDRLQDINALRKASGLPAIGYDEEEILDWVHEKRKELGWNGRQIRNAFQTAVALAEFEAKVGDDIEGSRRQGGKRGKSSSSRGTNSGNKKNKKGDKSKGGDKDKDDREKEKEKIPPRAPVIKVKHFRLIAKASKQFNEYLDQTHGGDEDRIAEIDEIRAPVTFTPKKTKGSSSKGVKKVEVKESSSSSSSSSSDEGGEEEDENDDEDDEKQNSGGESGDESDGEGGSSSSSSSAETEEESEGETKKKRSKGGTTKKETKESKSKVKSSSSSKREGEKPKKGGKKRDR